MQTLLVTGGAGFIGSCYVLQAIQQGYTVINVDALTYSGTKRNLDAVIHNPKHIFIHASITDKDCIYDLLTQYNVDSVVHFAAESHVDRSIQDPFIFVHTNVTGTLSLLEASRQYYMLTNKKSFRFIHISTDEVYGSLQLGEEPFNEHTPYNPSSPYSASKAGSDHLAHSYYTTYGLPTIITNCSNNYGPRQYPEKLIPVLYTKALAGEPLPIYGNGMNIRDWLYVEDHCKAIELVRTKGTIGETYCIGGNSEKTTLDIAHAVCSILDELCPKKTSYKEQISFVTDRAGHDFRYAINAEKIRSHLGWKPQESFENGLRKTIQWYLDNTEWVQSVQSKKEQISLL